jgi:hypothetical protein
MVPDASTTQIPCVIASTVCSHSRLPSETSPMSRVFCRAIAAWVTTEQTMSSVSRVKCPGVAAPSETAPSGAAAASGTPIQEPGGSLTVMP